VVNGLTEGDPTGVARVSVRFSRPVRPGQELTTKIFSPTGTTYGFETYTPGGSRVITGGSVDLHG
jgi:hypothetical protein